MPEPEEFTLDLVKVYELIQALTAARNVLKAKNSDLYDIKSGMERAWEGDDRWDSEGRPVVTRIIDSNEDTIELFSKNIKDLTDWLEGTIAELERH